MYDERTANMTKTDRVATRIEVDVEMVKSMTNRINRRTEEIVYITRTLGYFEPPKAGVDAPGSVAPVVTNMADALRDLSRAIDNLESSISLFN